MNKATLTYPGTSTDAGVPPTLGDTLNNLGRVLITSGAVYYALLALIMIAGPQVHSALSGYPTILALLSGLAHAAVNYTRQTADGVKNELDPSGSGG